MSQQAWLKPVTIPAMMKIIGKSAGYNGFFKG